MPYEEPEAGEWVSPIRRGYKMQCCDCGLVHKMDFRCVWREWPDCAVDNCGQPCRPPGIAAGASGSYKITDPYEAGLRVKENDA